MPIVTLNAGGIDIACLLYDDSSDQTRIDHRVPASVTTGLSGREARRPGDVAGELRFVATARFVLQAAAAQDLREGLATLGTTFIGLPLSIDRLTGAAWADRIYDAAYLIDFTAGAIVAADDELDPEHEYAPLLVGHVDQFPEIDVLDGELIELELTVVEDSPPEFALGINAASTSGTWPEALVPAGRSASKDRPEHGLTFTGFGEQRERQIGGQEMAFHWGQEADFTLADRDQVRALLAFFVGSQGPRKSFDQPWWITAGESSDEAPHNTRARFSSDTLSLLYPAGTCAETTIRVVQVPWEIAGVEGETPEQPPRCFLYKFVYSLPATQYYRFTNWPRDLVRTDDGTYVHAPFAHREITGTLDGRANTVSLESWIFAGNPLLLFHPFTLEAKLTLYIYEVEDEPIAPDAAVLRWQGEIKSVKLDERKLTATASFLGGLLDREVPGVLVGETCNTTLFSPRCGLVRADFEKAGTFESAAGCELTIATAADDAANTFVNGGIEIGGGATWEQRTIIASQPVEGGQKITVDWPVRQAAAGQDVVFFRGCDLTWETCKALGNQERFRGHPHVPVENLSIPEAQASAGGKKG